MPEAETFPVKFGAVEPEVPSGNGGMNLGNLTFQQLQELLTTLVHEAKKPDPEVAAKMAEEKARKVRTKNEMIVAVNAEIEYKKQLQMACPHRRDDGRTTYGGQVHSDGLIHPICMRCHHEATPYPAGNLVPVATGLG